MHFKIQEKKKFKGRNTHFPAYWAHFTCFYRKKKFHFLNDGTLHSFNNNHEEIKLLGST